MRPSFVLLAALALAAATAATAGASVERTPGSVALQLASGRGMAAVRSQGFLFGRVRLGRIVATRNVHFSENCERRSVGGSSMVECRGRSIGFATPPYPAKWRVVLYGRGISASGFVHGCLVLNGADSGSTGEYKIGRYSDFHRWPRVRWRHVLGTGHC